MLLCTKDFLDGWLMDKLKLINVRAAFAVEVAEPTWGVACERHAPLSRTLQMTNPGFQLRWGLPVGTRVCRLCSR